MATALETAMNWRWDGIRFELLHPGVKNSGFKGNNASCVLRIANSENAVLLSGDIEKAAERFFA